MASSSSSPSPSFKRARISSPEEYDVFLSFRGTDTRSGFISHLQESLKLNDIETFIDDKGLQTGDEISRQLEEAIDRSKIAIVVFSENYASSSWCLEELVRILKRQKNKLQTLMPVFYHVDPSDVRYQRTESFKNAFAKHEARIEIGKVDGWRAALSEAANISGLVSKDFRSEAELVKKIVEDVQKARLLLKKQDNPLNNELKKQLDSELQKARLLLDDAENRQLDEEGVKEWLDGFKHVNFQAEDLAEEIKNKNYGPTVNDEIESILTDLKNLLGQAAILELKHSICAVRDSPPIPPYRDERQVFGRHGDRDKILELLSSDGDVGGGQIGVIPIVGMGGLGKTTLARLVYDDERVKDLGFELRAWVTVSIELDVSKIIKSILQQIDKPTEVEEPTMPQRKMKEALRDKKFLFVLDNVWDEKYGKWDHLMSNFSTGVVGSRIIVTTRSKNVGLMVKTGPIYELGKVSREDCWRIFISHAFSAGDSSSYQLLHEIGGKIVDKCDGLPLAVMAMGGLLRITKDSGEWEDVLNNPIWERGENNQVNEVPPSLWLSYRYLPLSVKQCFSYCSVFPQDYKFDKEEMVLLWMAGGLLLSDEEGKRSMEEIGEKYFDDLVSRSLFQKSGIDESQFVMHDLVHGMAAFVSNELCVSVAEDLEFKRVTNQTRHLSHGNESFDYKLSIGLPKAKHLRSFLRQWGESWESLCDDEFVKELIANHRRLRALSICITDPISDSFCNLKHMRYLNLSHSHLNEVPSSVCTLFNLQTLILSLCSQLTQLPTDITKLIELRHLDISGSDRIKHLPPHMGNLKHLRYLNLSCCGFEELPSSVCTLFNLQTLILFECTELTQLPADITKLIKLRHLDISDTGLKHMPPHMGNLKKLRTLTHFIVGDPDIVNGCSNIKEMQELHHLSGTLSISGLENAAKFQDVGKDFLIHKANLKELVLKWDDTSIGRSKDKDVLDALQPHANLERLVIGGYQSALNSFALDQFPALRKLSLEDCRNLKEITNDGNSESLTEMELHNCSELESLLRLPKSLTHLRIERCSKLLAPKSHFGLQNLTALVSLSIRSSECESAATTSSSVLFAGVVLPSSLASLRLEFLRGFKSINGSAFQQAKSLKTLHINECNELVSLPEEELPNSLSTLKIIYCQLLERKYHKSNRDESYQHISHIPDLTIHGLTTIEMDHGGGYTIIEMDLGGGNTTACSNIREMQELQHLSGRLRISGLENAVKFQVDGKDILTPKKNLKELILVWADTSICRREDKEVLDALQPPTKLERLIIRGYQALTLPIWVVEMSYDKLESVELLNWRFCESLPPLGQLPSLLKLVIIGFSKLEKIGIEFYGNDSSTIPFECLETLEIGMISLKEWVFVDKAFPRLKKLKLDGCNDLPVSSIDCNTVEEFEIRQHSNLECFPLDQFPTLRKLILDDCRNLNAITNDGNSESLTKMTLVRCPEFESLLGLPKSLTHLFITSCDKLVAPKSCLDLLNLPALVSLSISDCKCESVATSSSSELFARVLLPSSLASLFLSDLGGFKSINGRAFQQVKSLTSLIILRCNELESLPEEKLPNSLCGLDIAECRLLERKYHKSKGDGSYQHISHIPNITISGHTSFEMDHEELSKKLRGELAVMFSHKE